jgi:hypothetical protein
MKMLTQFPFNYSSPIVNILCTIERQIKPYVLARLCPQQSLRALDYLSRRMFLFAIRRFRSSACRLRIPKLLSVAATARTTPKVEVQKCDGLQA